MLPRQLRYAARLTLLLAILAACSSLTEEPLRPRTATDSGVVAAASPLPLDFDAAQQTITRFLDAWRDADYISMYAAITNTVKENLSYSAFQSYYEEAARALTLQTIDYQLQAMVPHETRPDALLAVYLVTFYTNLVGSFSDDGRQLTLIQNGPGQWAIDWRPGLIFAEMDDGAALRLLTSETGRRNIYARDGQPLADQSGTRILVNLVPGRIPELNDCLAALALVTDQEEDKLRTKIARTPAEWLLEIGSIDSVLYFERQAAIDETLTEECAATLTSQTTRRYPDGRLAPHVIGYVGLPQSDELDEIALQGLDAETIVGRSGVEASWDETLRGQAGGELRIVSAAGETLRTLSAQGPKPAQSVWLTIQLDLQAFIRQALHRLYESGAIDEGSAGAAAIVMNVNDGAIHALVSYPDFDLNALVPNSILDPEARATELEELNDPRRPEFNRATQGIYPAGSVFKPVTYLAALDSGLYSLEHTFFCNGSWSRPQEGIVRTDWYPDGHSWVNTYTAIPQSCNPYFYESGFDLNQADPYRLPEYARRLGLGTLTGIGAIDEVAGAIEDPGTVRSRQGYVWTFSDAVSMAIGQGFVSITPLQIARMYAAIANGGQLIQPQLVWKSGLPGDEPSYQMEPIIQAELGIQPEVLERLHYSLCDVADVWYGTALSAFSGSPLLSRGVCGKTGTAQDLRVGNDWLPHAWFVTYMPADDPEIVVVVMVENSGEGSVVAAPLARQILEYYFFGRS